jgi:hypothetical protein
MRMPKRNSDPDPTQVVPFGQYGAGLITAHPVGLAIAIGLLLMGLFGLPGARFFFASALVVGGVWGLLLWLRHR